MLILVWQTSTLTIAKVVQVAFTPGRDPSTTPASLPPGVVLTDVILFWCILHVFTPSLSMEQAVSPYPEINVYFQHLQIQIAFQSQQIDETPYAHWILNL